MENNKKISVLISVFNQEKYIGRCIRSLLSQTLKDNLYEIIVVNDGSTDKTPYALKLFTDPNKSLVKVITNDKNIGLPASINKAIHNSKSEYLVRVDSDDWVSQEFLKFFARIFIIFIFKFFFLGSYKKPMTHTSKNTIY